MGHSAWSDAVYTAKVSSYARSSTKGFDHDVTCKATGRLVAHKTLDPKDVKVRESRDSKEHPESLAIAVFLDTTGSMSNTPEVARGKLGMLMSILIKNGYVQDPQILFGAINDATCDPVAIQVGQFESGADEQTNHLSNMVMVGGGGGQNTESYELSLYFMARHTSIDCMEKRNHKGYLFILGDELPYPEVNKDQVKDLIGDTLEANIPTENIIEELKQKFEIFYLLPAGTSNYGSPVIINHWSKLLGKDRVLKLQDMAMVSETIASLIGVTEGKTDSDTLETDLTGVGVDSTTAKSVSTAVAAYTGSKSVSLKKATVSGDLPVTRKPSVEKV